MPPAISDAEYVFQLFCDSGPVTLNTGDIAKKRKCTTGSIWGRINSIKKRHPNFQLSVSAKTGTALGVDTSVVSPATPKATPASRKKGGRASKASDREIASTFGTENRKRTRSVSKAREYDPDPEEIHGLVDEKPKDRKKSVQEDELDSNKENEHDKQDIKPTPKTRGGRKSVGRELEDSHPLELPKPARRGRNASKSRAIIAEDDSTDLVKDEVIKSIEETASSSPMKIKTTEFTKKLINSSDADNTGSKRKRSSSEVSIAPASPTAEDTKQKSPKTSPHAPQINGTDTETIGTAPILTPPESPSKRPLIKKQKLDHDHEIKPHIEEVGPAPEAASEPSEQPKPMSTDVLDQFIEPTAFSTPDMPTCGLVTNDEFPTTIFGGDRRKDDPAKNTFATNNASAPKVYAYQFWDDNAVPNPITTQRLGRVVGDEDGQEAKETDTTAMIE